MGSLKSNFAYKGILTFCNYIIGFVTFPYITRVLGPSNFGLVTYALNTIDYFLLFATLGIATLGTREVASARGNKDEVNNVFSNLFGVNLWFSILALVILGFCITFVDSFDEIRTLLWIGCAKIFFKVFAVEWYFTGMENFRYITIRSLAINTLYVISVFLFVKDPGDYLLYFTLTISVVVVNSLVNFFYASRFIEFKLRRFFTFKYIGQNIKLGLYFIMSSMYITFNVMYLGMVSTPKQVGYYSTAVKLYFIILSLFSAYTTVMLPRMSSIVSHEQNTVFVKHIQRSYYLVLCTALPLITVSIFMAPGIISIVSGEGYDASILPMRILMPVMVLVWLSQIIVFQGLIPLKKDKILLTTSLLGACSSILINILITQKYGAIGSAITLVCCEIIVTSSYVIAIHKDRIIPLPKYKDIIVGILWSIPYAIICVISMMAMENDIHRALTAGILSCILFVIVAKKIMLNRIKAF